MAVLHIRQPIDECGARFGGMVSSKGLADRFKRALDKGEDERARDRQAAERRAAEEEAARTLLLDQLSEFAEAVGHVSFRRSAEGLVLRRGERGLRFLVEGNAGLKVQVEGWPAASDHSLAREAALGDRWVLSFVKHGQTEKMPLFDRGLEELMVQGLGLPRPDAEPERPLGARTTAALVGEDAPFVDEPEPSEARAKRL